MKLFAVAVALSICGNVGGIFVAAPLLLFRERARAVALPNLVSYAIGTLLGVALLALLPEALAHVTGATIFGDLLAGILVFFALEKLVVWHHCHAPAACEVHRSSAATLVLLGGAIHNFADGAVITAAVLSSLPLGVSTALAVAAHQIPQEVGDFAILLNAGYSRSRAFLFNVLSGCGSLAGGVTMYLAAESLPDILPRVLAFAAGSFLYVAMADLIPDLHRGELGGSAIRQVLLIGAGVGTILLL